MNMTSSFGRVQIFRRRPARVLFAFVVSAWLVVSANTSAAQDASPLQRMLELNRTGEWAEAARLAEEFLRASPARPLAERCEAYTSLAYSQMRLRQTAQALATLDRFTVECRELPEGHWLRGLASRTRRELTGAPPPSNSMRAGPPAGTRPDPFWQTVAPASVGVDARALEQHRRLCERTGADACLVVRRGKLVQELYSARYREPVYAMSSTKSVTGLLAGMLLDDGKIKSIDEPVCRYVSEWCEGRRAKVTLRHLLTMTSGLPRMFDEGVASTNDKNPFVIRLTPTAEPGTSWAYSNEGVQLLSPVLDRAAGEPLQDYARRRLFGPLGMNDTRLHLDEKGHAWTYADMETTPRDLARVGLLMLNKGVWQGRRVVSAAWVEQSTRASQQIEPRYGLLWWLYENPKGFAALGYLDTNLYVFPAQELVVVRMQAKPFDGGDSYEPEALQLFARMARR